MILCYAQLRCRCAISLHEPAKARAKLMDAQCRNDLCRQWPDKVDVARGAENTGTSSGKSLKLIALPCPIGDDGYC
jgi:hypothetical protein